MTRPTFTTDELAIIRRAARRVYQHGCRGERARKWQNGPMVHPMSEDAQVWCAVGAIQRERGSLADVLLDHINEAVEIALDDPQAGLAAINDIRGPRAAARVLRELVKREEARLGVSKLGATNRPPPAS